MKHSIINRFKSDLNLKGIIKNSNSIDMLNGPVLSNMLLFTVPLMLSSILQLLFNAADIIVVGKFAGDNALAAVGSNTALINLFTNFFLGFSIGANVLVARYFGAKKNKEVSKTVHTSMTLSIIFGLIMTFVGVIFAGQILRLMDTPANVLPLATTYLRIYFLGMSANMIYNFGAAILRAVGDTKRPFTYLLFAGVVNVILNLIFVILLDMDVAGVALATVISQFISAGLVVRCLMKENSAIRVELGKLHIDRQKLIKIIQIGLPASFQGMLFSISNVVIQSSINSFGETVVAGSSAAANLESFVYVAMNAFHQAALTFTSQNVGAGRYERTNKILFTALGCVTVVGLVLGNTVVIFGDKLLLLYTESEAVVAQGMIRLHCISRVYAVCGIMDVMVGALRGLGYSLMPMIVSLLGACGLRLLWIFTFFRLDRFHTISLLYYVYLVSWIITVFAHFICYYFVKKKLNKSWKMLSENQI